MKTICVVAAKGRLVPIPSSVASAPGGRPFYVNDSEPRTLPNVSSVRRRIDAGDLIEVKPTETKSSKKES
jgi:hypothetical protein